MHDAHNDLCDDAQRSLRANQEACKIISRCIVCPSANLYNLSFRCDYLNPKHMVSSNAINESMWPTSVFAHIATNSTRSLATGIGHIIETLWIKRIAQMEIYQAWLHNGA